MLLNIRNIIKNKALFKSVRLVANGTFHSIHELGDIFGDFTETGSIHMYTHDLL